MKLRYLLFLAPAAVLSAATAKNPANCSSRPCVYTITCAAATCTSAEVAEVQAALNDAWRGDTIKLQAGRIFPAPSSAVQISRRSSGSSGYLTLTTTEDASLPEDAMTRITPHWESKMPVIRADSGNRALFVQCTPPVEYLRIRGVIFDSATSGAQVLTVGCVGASLLGRTASADSDQPDNIIVEQCVFRNPGWNVNQQAAYIGAFARGLLIRSNWISGGRWPGVEVQAILILNGPGPVDVINNYLGDTGGETVMHGSEGPMWDVSPSGSIILNAFYNHPERMLGLNSTNPTWQANTVVFKGRYIKHSNGWFRALNSGVTGSSQPAFPTSGSVNDNGITWSRTAASTAASQIIMKNLYESKDSRDVTNAWNQYRGYTAQAQYQTVVYKLSNCVQASSSCQCVPRITGRVNTNGVTVTSADGNRLPNSHYPVDKNGVAAKSITIGGASYKISDFQWDNDYTLTLTSSAGTQSNVAYTYGQTNCRAASNLNNVFAHNIVEDGTQGIQMVQFDNGMQWKIGNLLVKNNLFRNIDCAAWGSCGGTAVKGFNWFAYGVPGTTFESNTIIDSQNANSGGILVSDTNQITGRGLRRFRANIWPKSSGAGLAGSTPTTTEGDATTRQHICNQADCTADQVGYNVIAGVNLANYAKGGPTYNLCSTAAACAVDASMWTGLFQGYGAGNLKPRTDHAAFHGGPRGESIGADYQMLPLVRNLDMGEGPKVTVGTTTATFSYWLHQPQLNHGLVCSLEISTTRDMDNLITVADPNGLTDANGRDGSRRSIAVSGLNGNTTYWYRLHCGPIYEGSFKTN